MKKENTHPVILTIAYVISIGGALGLGGWAKSLYDRESDLTKEKIDFAQHVSDETIKLNNQDLSIQKERLEVDAREKQVKLAIDSAANSAAQASQEMQAANKLAEQTSPTVQATKTEGEIAQLMSEFSSLGANLQGPPPCDDKEALKNYYRGSSILREISSRAQSIHEWGKYQYFIESNSGITVWASDYCELKNTAQQKDPSDQDKLSK